MSIRLGGDLDFTLADTLVCSRPVPYECVVTPRFPEALTILVEERGRCEN